MKKTALFLLTIGLWASACKKDRQVIIEEDTRPSSGAFTIEGQSFLSDYTYWNGTEGLVLTNVPKAPSYIENTVRISVDSLFFSHTYTYMDRKNPAYDNRKHFSEVVVKYTPSGIYGTGQVLTGVTAGTMNVGNNGNTFMIDYDITVANRRMQGTYIGKVAGKRW